MPRGRIVSTPMALNVAPLVRYFGSVDTEPQPGTAGASGPKDHRRGSFATAGPTSLEVAGMEF